MVPRREGAPRTPPRTTPAPCHRPLQQPLAGGTRSSRRRRGCAPGRGLGRLGLGLRRGSLGAGCLASAPPHRGRCPPLPLPSGGTTGSPAWSGPEFSQHSAASHPPPPYLTAPATSPSNWLTKSCQISVWPDPGRHTASHSPRATRRARPAGHRAHRPPVATIPRICLRQGVGGELLCAYTVRVYQSAAASPRLIMAIHSDVSSSA